MESWSGLGLVRSSSWPVCQAEPEYYREVVGMRAEADTLLELALDRMSEQTGIERTEESTVRVDRTALATLADNKGSGVKKIQEDGKWRKKRCVRPCP